MGELLSVTEGESGRTSGKGAFISATEGLAVVVRVLSWRLPGLDLMDRDIRSSFDSCSRDPFRTGEYGGDEGGVICPSVIQYVRRKGERH